VLLCRDCLHQARADYGALIAAGRGDVPLIELRWRAPRAVAVSSLAWCAAHAGRGISAEHPHPPASGDHVRAHGKSLVNGKKLFAGTFGDQRCITGRLPKSR
jgi:hypothetical protein